MSDREPDTRPAAPVSDEHEPAPEANGPAVAAAPANGSMRAATPMMAQYIEIKAANPDSLLFYRMGDFYELFFDDAVAASAALSIALTKRGKHAGDDIPMCGVPVHSADSYLQQLIRKGFRVAVCEQMEDPKEAKKRGAKAVVRRDVVRLVTPGTLTEDALLDARRHNFLAALGRSRGSGDALALAWVDISTGEIQAMATSEADLAADLARIEPGELLVAEGLLVDDAIARALAACGAAITAQPATKFDSTDGGRRLRRVLGVEALDGFGDFGRAELGALGALVAYVELTQVGRMPKLKPPKLIARSEAMIIDPATRASLELARTLQGARAGSLADTIDRTVTGAGGRLLAARLLAPSTDPAVISARLDAVAHFFDAAGLRSDLRERLRGVPDMARALSRLALGRGGPRDLGTLRTGLVAALGIPEVLDGNAVLSTVPEQIARARQALIDGPSALRDRLQAWLAEELPARASEGGFIATGIDAELDEARALRDESRRVIAALEQSQREATGIRSLKVRHNNVLGYFIEVTAQHGDRLLSDPETFIHRQTLANAIRFTTAELAALEVRIGEAAATAQAVEIRMFDALAEAALGEADALSEVIDAVASLDVAAGLAELAERRRYVRPSIGEGTAFRIRGGRHPVVESALDAAAGAAGTGRFVANDCDLTGPSDDHGQLWLVTGPNMAGKSTFLRQNALIAVMAQMGSFVPAEEAEIGIVDRLFSRVGASDDLAGGRSTFMVEMVETAAILNQAGPRALVILDEIGRGTATFDGLAIAWAALEHLHEVNRCRTLFATHFHELTALTTPLDRLENHTMRVREWQGDVIFLHEVVAGAADRSYGVQVGRLAGLPEAVVARATEVLEALEKGGEGKRAHTIVDDLPLFALRPMAPKMAAAGAASPLTERLQGVLPDEMSPREAHELLYELKRLAGRKED